MCKNTESSSTKKMAICILAHTDAEQLNRLIESLDSAFFDLYIHLDKKVDIFDFKKTINKTKISKVQFIDERYDVRWGDISIVDATIAMLRAADQVGGYRKYINLSGLDYPIQSNEKIFTVLNNDKEFISGNLLEKSEYHKLECIHFWKFKLLNRASMLLYDTIHYRFRDTYYIDMSGNSMDVYFAPQWHALTSECVEYILSFLNNEEGYRDFFKFSYAPDELFIPTLVFNSAFRKKTIKCEFPEGTHYNNKTAIHYINYNPVVEVLDENSFAAIIESNKLFCRKIKSNTSKKLIQLIDEYRLADC